MRATAKAVRTTEMTAERKIWVAIDFLIPSSLFSPAQLLVTTEKPLEQPKAN